MDYENPGDYGYDIPPSHNDLTDLIGEDFPTRDYSPLEDGFTYALSGLATGIAVSAVANRYIGLETITDVVGGDPFGFYVGLPLAGFAAGIYGSVKKSEIRRKERSKDIDRWYRAQDLGQTSENLEEDLRDEDYVLVRDNIYTEIPVERHGDLAAELYREVYNRFEPEQYVEEMSDYPGIDLQVSLVENNEVLRSFCIGEAVGQKQPGNLKEADEWEKMAEDIDTISLEEWR